MIYIGNYASWVQDEWVDYLLQNNGTPRPKTTSENPDSEEFRIATSAGYDLTQTYWYFYNENNKNFPFEIELPIEHRRSFRWWFNKTNPGMFMPMHRDPHASEEINCNRYWMSLQDYVPGHVFIYNNQLLTNYKKGDIWMYDNAQDVHGSCNIGYTPRLIFNFSLYD